MTVDEAIELILKHAGCQPTTRVPVTDALGCTLAESVHADIDSPPFDKAMMDGYGVRSADLLAGATKLQVVGEVTAGSTSSHVNYSSEIKEGGGPAAVYITTGSPVPDWVDAVVMVERAQRVDDSVILTEPNPTPGLNIMRRGTEFFQGDMVLSSNSVIGPAEMGVLASVGAVQPLVYQPINLSILTTGDEIIDPSVPVRPGPGQIRNSNASVLMGLALSAKLNVTNRGIVRDEPELMRPAIGEALHHADILILTGGVSAGKKDYVPSILSELGVSKVFHKVDFKPGKPIYFGTFVPPGKTDQTTLVFGLPGNPVSVLACFELFVQTALRCRQGERSPPHKLRAKLHHAWTKRLDRLTYHPGRVWCDELGQLNCEAITWQGSPDMKTLTKANCFLVLHAQTDAVPAGSVIEIMLLTGRQLI